MDKSRLAELARLFLKLGFTAFGGPAAHIAMMQKEVVNKRNWMDEQHFLDLIGATNLIPGPNSTEMAIHIGRERAGLRGLIVAGLCFILPAVCITGAFAWFYRKYGAVPEVQVFVYGIKPAIIAVILSAVYPLAKKSLKSIQLGIIALAVLILALLNVNEILLLFGAGFTAIILISLKRSLSARLNLLMPLLFSPAGAANPGNMKLFWIFVKIGSILYGSGYVLFAFLDTELVARGLLNRQQLMDAIAVGQFTPGPVFSSVTFIGYQMGGLSGAAASTMGIFLPSFVFVALLNPLVKKMRNSPLLSSFLDAVNVASVAIILSVCYLMARETVNDWRTVLIALLSLLIGFRFPGVNSAFVVLGGAVGGYLLSFI